MRYFGLAFLLSLVFLCHTCICPLSYFRRFKVNVFNTLDPDDPWSGILGKLTWANWSTTHISLKATPGQIAFGRDILYDLAFTVNWNDQSKKSQRRRTNNQQENRKRIKYHFKVNDEVMLERNTLQRKMSPMTVPSLSPIRKDGNTERYRVRTRQHQTNLSLSVFWLLCVGGYAVGKES